MTKSGQRSPTQDAPRIDFKKYALANGLEVILSEDHRLPVVAVNLWYHVGPANERPGRTGFAHLFEHMMFQGSKHVGENQIKVLQAAGATGINGTTGFDRTNFFETLPAEQLELALWLESDRMAFLLETLTARNLANQRDVVRNERRQRENSPYSLVEEELFRQLFPSGHPYRASIIGSHADIESVGLQDIRDFCKQFYVPNNAGLALVGDFDPGEARRLVEKYFGPVPSGPSVPKSSAEKSTILSAKRVTITDRVELPRIYKAWLTAPVYQPGEAELNVLAQILGGSSASRLYQRLVRTDQIAQSVSVGHQSMTLGSVFMLVATLKPGVTLDSLEKALDEELQTMQSNGPTAEELNRARNAIQTSFVFSLEQAGAVADRLNHYNHHLGDPGYLARDWQRHEAVSVADVQRVARELVSDTSVTIWGVPGPKVLAEVPRRTDSEMDVEAAPVPVDHAWRAQPPKARPKASAELPQHLSFELANGLKVLFLEQHHIAAIAARLVTLGGSGANPGALPGLASFTSAIQSRGTSRRSQQQLARDFDLLGAHWSVSSNTGASTVSMRVLKKSAAAAFEVFSDVALNPDFASEEIERVRRERLVSISQQSDNPGLLAQRELLRALYAPEHPYSLLEIGTEASNKSIERNDLLQFYSRSFAPRGAALVIVGDATVDEAVSLAEKYFGSWSGSAPGAQVPSGQRPDSRRVLIIDRPGSPQTELLIGQLGPARSHPDYPAIEVMNALLGGIFSSRINNNLREVHGYTYGAKSQFIYHRDAGRFVISGAIRTDATAAAVSEIFIEIDRVRETLPTPEELAVAKGSVSRSLISRFDASASSAGSLSELFVYGLDPGHFKTTLAKIPAVSLADVRRIAMEHLHPESTVAVAVGDSARIESELNKLHLGSVQRISGQPAPVQV